METRRKPVRKLQDGTAVLRGGNNVGKLLLPGNGQATQVVTLPNGTTVHRTTSGKQYRLVSMK